MRNHKLVKLIASRGSQLQLVLACGFGLLLGAACLWFSPLWALGGVLGVLFLVAIADRPELGLLGIVLIASGLIDSERLPLFGMGPISLHITDVILLYLLALVLAKALVVPSFKVVRTALDVPLMWFYVAVLLSAVLAIGQPSVGTSFVLRRLRPLSYYLGFFAVTNLIRHRRQLTVLIGGLFVIAVVASLVTLIQVLFPSLHLVGEGTPELVTAGREYLGVVRTYAETDRVIYLMLLVSVCSLILGGRWLPPTLELARAGILAIGIFLSFQRGYWLTMSAMLGLLGVLASWPQRSRILRWAIVSVVAVILIVSLPGGGGEQYTAAAWDRLVWGMRPDTLAQDDSVQARVMETRYAIQSIAQQPLLGIGLGNFYRPAVADDAGWKPDDPSIGLRWYVHNAYLWVWVMMGLMGLIPFVWLYARVLTRGFARWRKIDDPKLRVVVLGSTLGILGQAIGNVVAPNFIQSWSLIVFAIILGINELIYQWEVSELCP